MKIVEKFKAKVSERMENPPVTIAFLGDSVTQGCFEIYQKDENALATVHDRMSGYWNCVQKIFSLFYPEVPVTCINAGLSGTTAFVGLHRVERDVLAYNPDLVVVCFGLNDCRRGESGIERYSGALEGIFKKLLDAGKEVIFMTPNMSNTKISPHIRKEDSLIYETAQEIMGLQNDGILDKYMDAARDVCKTYGIPVCDCYAKWKQMETCGIDVTELLSNKINHPIREMHWLFAGMLVDTMLS